MSQRSTGEPREADFRSWLADHLGGHLGLAVPEDGDLTEYGLDSVAALGLFGDIEEAFGPLIEPADIRAHPTARKLARLLASRAPGPGGTGPRVAFVFGGQGAQHPGMTTGLLRHSPVYRRHLEEAAAALLPYTGLSVAAVIRRGDGRVDRTAFTQPALFAVGYALARTLQEAGVRPAAVLGHGAGEFAAAVVAGALTLPDAAKLVSLRGALMQCLPPGGGMTATCAAPGEAAELLAEEPEAGIGAVNAARATVLSGAVGALERVRGRLEAGGIACRRLRVTHAFHSPLMEPVLPAFETAARRLPGGAPRLPYYSTVRGRLTAEPLGASYWIAQITAPVRFADAVRNLLARQAPTHVVELGPRRVLTPFLRRMGGTGGPVCLAVCRGPESGAADLGEVLAALDARSPAGASARARGAGRSV